MTIKRLLSLNWREPILNIYSTYSTYSTYSFYK